jgi:uncharacterized protein
VTTDAQLRLIAADVLTAPVEADGVSEALATATAELGEVAGVSFGLWEAGPGVDVDVEADELFLVLQGRGEVSFEDGSRLALAPGVLVRLRAGDRTTWTIEERLRKLYVVDAQD